MSVNLKSQSPRNRGTSIYEGDYKEFCTLLVPDVETILLALIDDAYNKLPSCVCGAAARSKDKAVVKNRLKSEGLAFATLTLPKLWAGLASYFETGQVLYPSFSLKGTTGHPCFLSGLFRLAYGTGEDQITAVTLIYQISVIFSKIKGPYPEDVLSKQLADFVSVDKELDDINFLDEVREPIMERARDEIQNLMRDFSMDTCVPRPGPGATNTPVAKHLRYRPHVLYEQIDTVLPYVDWFYVHPWDCVDQTKHLLELEKAKVKEPTARFKFVHKKVGKARGICIEQNEMQFLQQAVKHGIYRYVESHPSTKGRVNFSDQSVNARLALESSRNRRMATIDMSEASDRVHRHLVSYLFHGHELHDVLMALSTRSIELPEGSQPSMIRISKYAPMGSGLCFPIMSLIHWALIRAIIHLSMLPNDFKRNVYVYGDDIIIPCDCIEAVYTYLPLFGMKLNVDKSFYRSSFRESCGVHAFDGVDITPVYVKYILTSTNMKHAMSCIQVESQMYHKGFHNVAAIMRENVEKHFGALPITPSLSPEFGFKRLGAFTPDRVKPVRVKIDPYGEPVWRVRMVSPIQSKDCPPTEYECYLRHVLTKTNARFMGGSPDGFELSWTWLRTPQINGVQLYPILPGYNDPIGVPDEPKQRRSAVYQGNPLPRNPRVSRFLGEVRETHSRWCVHRYSHRAFYVLRVLRRRATLEHLSKHTLRRWDGDL